MRNLTVRELYEVASIATARSGSASDFAKYKSEGLLKDAADGWIDLTPKGQNVLESGGYQYDPKIGWKRAVESEASSDRKMEITNNIDSSEPIKQIRVVVDVSYLDCKVSAVKLIGMLDDAVRKRLMVKELACGEKVFGFATNYLHQRSSLNDTPHIRAYALEQIAEVENAEVLTSSETQRGG